MSVKARSCICLP